MGHSLFSSLMFIGDSNAKEAKKHTPNHLSHINYANLLKFTIVFSTEKIYLLCKKNLENRFEMNIFDIEHRVNHRMISVFSFKIFKHNFDGDFKAFGTADAKHRKKNQRRQKSFLRI